MSRTLLLLWTFLACERAPERSEVDGLPARAAEWALTRGHLHLTPTAELVWRSSDDAVALDAELIGLPAVAGERVVWSARTGKGATLYAWEPGETPRALTAEGTPDRPALSPDGETVVFVSGSTGLASLWAMPFQGGAPVQLTNQGLASAPRAPGQPPEGFVAPPHRGPPEVGEDGVVRWEAPDGSHALRLP